jgi:uncharacterized membrane protein YjjB (DUF3815 family)
MNFWFKFFLVFLCVAVTDTCWAFYIIKVAEKKALPASLWGSLISMLSAFAVITYTENHYYIIATVFGAFVGTMVAIKLIKK